MSQNVISNNFILANAGSPLLDMIYVNANQVVSASGQNNLYTVPAGRRALIPAIYCNAQSSVGVAPSFNNGGTYFQGGGNLTSLTAGIPQNIMLTIPLILDAGEILSIYLQSNLSVNVWPQIIEFSNVSAVKSGKVLNLASGNNLLYTCPAGKTACFLDTKLNFGGISATAFNVGASGSGVNYFMYVPSGQSPGISFRISNNVTISGTASYGQSASSATRGPSLGPGDMIYSNCSLTNNCCAMFNLIEF